MNVRQTSPQPFSLSYPITIAAILFLHVWRLRKKETSITNISGYMHEVLAIFKNTWGLNGADREWRADVQNCPSSLDLKQNVFTCFFCPILCALACACRSFCGFQSESNITTVSADAKLIPNPPALVDSKKQKSWNYKVGNSFIYNTLIFLKELIHFMHYVVQTTKSCIAKSVIALCLKLL